MYRSVLTPLAFEVALAREQPPWQRSAYRKILVPLDKSREAEGVLPYAQELLAPESQGILLHVVPPGRLTPPDEYLVLGSRQEGGERIAAMGYLRCVVNDLIQAPGRWRCVVVTSRSVAEGIASFAVQEGVDLIAMYTHDRKGLARLVRGSIARRVQRSAPIELRVLRPRELISR